ncbi:27669_t:CDS:1, partial [Dentiscutata erythropus]
TITATFTPTSTLSIIQIQTPGYLQDTNVINTFIGEVIFIIVVAITTAVLICRYRNKQNKLQVQQQEFERQQIVNSIKAI